MKFTNKEGLPQPFVDAVKNDDYDPGVGTWRSVTSLIGPAQKATLFERHKDKIEEDVSDRIWALFGQVVHGILERATTEGLPEERYYMTVQGKKISGQTDNLVFIPDGSDGWELQDYKSTSVWKYRLRDFQDWEHQLNMYKVLLEANEFKITRLKVFAMWRDWRYGEWKQNKLPSGYPDKSVSGESISIWPSEVIMKFINERVSAHIAAEKLPDDKLPHCTDEEMWTRHQERPYAVMKEGQKKARRLFLTPNLANDYIETQKDKDVLSIQYRKPEYIRCERYCNVARFCHQNLNRKHGEANDHRDNQSGESIAG